MSAENSRSWPRDCGTADDATRAIRFLLASAAEEGAINSAHNAENLRDDFAQRSRATLYLFSDLQMATSTDSNIGKTHLITKEN